jgi:DNA polymerase-1
MTSKLFGSPSPVLAIDVANLAWRAAYSPGYSRMKLASGTPSGHVFGSFKMISSLPKGEKWFALEGRPSKRLKLYPGYKANRDRSAADGEVPNPFPDVANLVKQLPGQSWYHPHREADDLIALMCGMRTDQNLPITVVSNDKDLWQLIRPGLVEVWNSKAKRIVSPSDIKETFGVSNPRSIPVVKALFGDSSDNIPPCAARIIKKPVLELIESQNITSLSNLLETLPVLKPEKTRDKILDGEEQLKVNYKLVKLRTKSQKTTPPHNKWSDRPFIFG